MKVKIIGFKVGVSRPTYNKTIEINDLEVGKMVDIPQFKVTFAVCEALRKSDFLSIRRVDDDPREWYERRVD